MLRSCERLPGAVRFLGLPEGVATAATAIGGLAAAGIFVVGHVYGTSRYDTATD